ncbi:hypothetical protein C5167_003323 [Papaver somniferum]|uniref:Uncharacterized protein n=1 Tax=Papaver somniferum TaxID=3469 RepID=A0A4Y7L3W3_PAPSO|nr:hypothetical protein C5167_003323 [Papaver somniferum]
MDSSPVKNTVKLHYTAFVWGNGDVRNLTTLVTVLDDMAANVSIPECLHFWEARLAIVSSTKYTWF